MNNIEIFPPHFLGSVQHLELILPHGWSLDGQFCHALKGDNGVGKSSIIKLMKLHANSLEASFFDQFALKSLSKINCTEAFELVRKHVNNFDNKTFKELIKTFQFEEHLQKEINLLSGGENQIFKFILCLSLNSSLYVFDEPFNHLSEDNFEKFKKIINKKLEKKTVLLIDHDQKRLNSICQRHWSVSRLQKSKITIEEMIEC